MIAYVYLDLIQEFRWIVVLYLPWALQRVNLFSDRVGSLWPFVCLELVLVADDSLSYCK